jgi:hypothetical protein
MPKVLIVSFQREGMLYVNRAMMLGMDVRILGCVENYRHQLVSWYGDKVLHVQGRRTDVKRCVTEEQFDVAIVQEEANYVQTALITQSLYEAGIGQIIVVTPDPSKRILYRRCGANHTIIASNEEQAWSMVKRLLPTCVSA